ncbi:ImmA/IrrE family metallo-endopeptidase [Exiguobacterium sp. SH5S13]|uniref:ImmA/IrrE family metallo-endopeptidase n=1 Tax=unclassified Exiguobacterium TaxID=2644629 RepID=UPI00103C6ECC|nr:MULTISPECIES: ImmA/IrrE family metallo-endopeptidase [unclassified Exiguobacterium]TCI24813.1 ImmA/IrrE family metallo-endopeptidase [Exiguobacterium sp. SH5S4]TCI49757.1 ImmA/IrrE family metallo-endopeptidase [Exiguobacterium sp. SH5S13]
MAKMKTNEERKAELEALTEQMGQQIDSYFESPEKIREHLQFLGKFHQYSMRNAVLIESQFPGAVAVGSYPFWEKQGAQVQKGERGIKVFVPNPVTYALHKDEWVPLSKAPKPVKDGVKQGRIPSRKMMYFKIGHVFEYTQTDAREKGIEVSDIFKRYHRDGGLENEQDIRDALTTLADARNVTLLEEPLDEIGTAKGCYYPELHAIALNPRNTSIEDITVLIHELAHTELHNQERNFERDQPLTAPEKEFQAEMVAYVVSHQLGFPTDDFSLSYLAGWTKDKELLDKEQLLQEVHQTSAGFLDHIESHLEKVHALQQEKEQSPLDYLEQLERRMGWKDADLSLYERVHAVQSVSPEEVEPYLNAKATLETNLKMDRVDGPLMYIHDKGFGFQSFGVANNHDFNDDALVVYTIALPDQPLISGHFDPEKTVHPLHDLEKNNKVEKPTLKNLEDNWHDVLLADEKEPFSRTAFLNIERLV